MSKVRDWAMILGLAGMLLMAAADTKDVLAAKPAGKNLMYREIIPEKKIINENSEEKEKQETAEETMEETETASEEAASPERVVELSEADYSALLRIVEAEASGEDIKGKMLVANVVLNRVENSAFPDTVEEVVYQRAGGKAQFSPVATGKIERVQVSESTVEAVERVLCGEDESEGALYFIARAHAETDNLHWFERNLTKLFTYRGHEFYT